MLFQEFLHDYRLDELTDKEWRVYWKIIMHIHDRSADGRVPHTWHLLSAILGVRNRNITLFRILQRLHRDQKVIWENYEEFASRIPLELRDRLGIDPDIGVSEQGTIPVWKVCKGGGIRDKVVLFAPQVIELHKAFGRQFRKKRKPLQPGFEPCPYHDECQLLRMVRGKDYCSDGTVAR